MTTLLPPLEREHLLAQWIEQQLSVHDIHLQPITNDAGFRRYFRFAEPSQWLAVDAPPHTEDSRQFIALADYLSSHGVNTPRILAADEHRGFLLVEDFGDELLQRQLTPTSVNSRYQQAFSTLRKLQSCPDDKTLIPRYDRQLLQRELLIFSEWFVTGMLQYNLDTDETQLLERTFSLLESSACRQPQTLVHRDFHSRNLLVDPANNLGVIDFQGALWGPFTYDLVSLLRDCYIRWPIDQVKNWALDYRQQAVTAGLLNANISATEYLTWFDWMGLQRHIKVLGIFARLHLRDNKHHYLHDLPLVIRYTLEVTQAYPELQDFHSWFTQRLLPSIEQQSWYSNYQQAGDQQ